MIYTVTYVPSATDELADLWNNAPDRNAMSRASDEIDRILKYDAELQGVPSWRSRVLYVPPLAVTFTVSREDCLFAYCRYGHLYLEVIKKDD